MRASCRRRLIDVYKRQAVQRDDWQPVVKGVERRTSLSPRGGVIFFLALALLALLLSFGDNAFLYPLFYRCLLYTSRCV